MTQLKGFKFVTKAEIIINESGLDDLFQSIYTKIITKLQKSSGKGLGWIIVSVIDHTVSTFNYNPLAGSSYIKLPKELDHSKERLINIQNIDDNECFKWCLVRYLNPENHHPARIAKAGKDFAKTLDFVDTNFPIEIRDIHKMENKNSIRISLFSYENKEKRPIYASKNCCKEKYVVLLLIG